MAPLIDSIYTDPEALRLLYRNPRNQTGGLPDASQDTNTQQPQTYVPPITPQQHCPAVGQFTIMRVPGSDHGIMPAMVQAIREGIDYLWNPIDSTFRLVERARRVAGQPCVLVKMINKAESVVSISDMIIRSFEDETGIEIHKLLLNPGDIHHAMTSIDFQTLRSEIDTITDIGEREVIEFSLEGGGVYASGTMPTKLTLRHNKAPDPPDVPLE